jgi:hypothetical protein
MPHPMKELAEVEHRVATLYASLELSQSTWLVTSLSPGSVTMSKHLIAAGDGPGLVDLLARLRTKAEQVAGVPVEIVVWVNRVLEANRIESHVVDAAKSPCPDDVDARRPMPLTARPCCGLCWPGNAESRASAQFAFEADAVAGKLVEARFSVGCGTDN